jgi:hypothetical protein
MGKAPESRMSFWCEAFADGLSLKTIPLEIVELGALDLTSIHGQIGAQGKLLCQGVCPFSVVSHGSLPRA